MPQPENHALVLLREMREKMRASHAELRTSIEDLTAEVAGLREGLAGQTVLGHFAAKGIGNRLEDRERRVTALERARG